MISCFFVLSVSPESFCIIKIWIHSFSIWLRGPTLIVSGGNVSTLSSRAARFKNAPEQKSKDISPVVVRLVSIGQCQMKLYSRSYWLHSKHPSAERRLARWAASYQPEWEAERRGGGRGLHQAWCYGGAPENLPLKIYQIVTISVKNLKEDVWPWRLFEQDFQVVTLQAQRS